MRLAAKQPLSAWRLRRQADSFTNLFLLQLAQASAVLPPLALDNRQAFMRPLGHPAWQLRLPGRCNTGFQQQLGQAVPIFGFYYNHYSPILYCSRFGVFQSFLYCATIGFRC